MGETRLVIGAVPINMVDLIWDKCIPHLDKSIALAPLEISLDTIKSSLHRGRTMMITVSEGNDIIAVNIIEKLVYSTGHSVVLISIIGGTRLSEWMKDFQILVHNIAKDLDCSEIRGIASRKGWLRALNKAGYPWYRLHEIIGCKIDNLEDEK